VAKIIRAAFSPIMPGDLSYSDTGQLTARSERRAARASRADQDRIGLEAGFKSLNLLDV